MHELALTSELVAVCQARAEGQKVIRVVLEVGALTGVVPDAVRFCYGLCTEGTDLAGSTLEIRETPTRATCQTCGAVFLSTSPWSRCQCGSAALALDGGDVLRIIEMELEGAPTTQEVA